MESQPPVSLPHPSVGLHDPPGHGHEKGERDVRGGLGQDPRGVPDGDATPRHLRHVYVVHANGELADDLQAGGLLNRCAVDPVHDVGQHPVHAPQRHPQLLRRRWAIVRPYDHLRLGGDGLQCVAVHQPCDEYPRSRHMTPLRRDSSGHGSRHILADERRVSNRRITAERRTQRSNMVSVAPAPSAVI